MDVLRPKLQWAEDPAERVGGRHNPRPFHGQCYRSLVKSCLRNACLFEDPLFPATRASLGDVRQQVVFWRRPQEIHWKPQFFVGGASRFDVCQGRVGDCWFLAALASLTMQQELFNHIVPPDQNFQREYCGIFRFRFWYFGDWVEVVVDDRLPTDDNNQLIFVSSCDKNEFWCALLEKAYAKLYGSYGDLQMGQIAEAMVDFTGGIKLEISLRSSPSNLWRMLKRAIDLGSFVGCTTSSLKIGEMKTADGLVMTHAYSVTGAEQVRYQNQIEELVRVRNPWGDDVEWNKAWSDGSSEWSRVDAKIRERLLLPRDDGEFWMAVQDFEERFHRLVICSPTPDFLRGAGQQEWAMSIHHGSWLKGYSAGGPLHRNNDLYCSNPQYRVTLTEDNMDSETGSNCFLLSLVQKPRSQHRSLNLRLKIACHVFKLQVQDQKLPQSFFDEQCPVKQGLTYVNAREVSETYQLGPGTYVIVPSTNQPNEQAEFVVRTCFQKGTQHNTQLSLKRQEYSDWEQIFDQYAQVPDRRWSLSQYNEPDMMGNSLSPNPMSPSTIETWHSWGHHKNGTESRFLPSSPTLKNAELDAAGLQKVLNQVFLRDEVAAEGFSLDHCRGMALLINFDSLGKLNKHDFRCFWGKIEALKKLFHERDIEGSGLLDMNSLFDCLYDMGYPAGMSGQKLMSLRYADPLGRVSLESFIHCCLRVEFATKMFNKLSRGQPGLSLSANEWMLFTTYF
ncbi:calpain-9-like isoform X2 [Hypanus sabinus]|uniref:calpain-9-like isoform X2 n=1 Tax=Hypanus sabinus TaxID=79690 RepID=UPI0028C424D4|nr:calpain-9-like isoform X2 [Hypanus sabinus]